MRENPFFREYPDVDVQATTTHHSGGEFVWEGNGARPDRNHRLYEEIVTPEQLICVLQNERVQALLSMCFEREDGRLDLEERDELRELLCAAGVPSISFRSTIDTVLEDIIIRRELQGNGNSPHD